MSYRNQDNTARNVVIQLAFPRDASRTRPLCKHALSLPFRKIFFGLLAALNSTLICGLLPVLFVFAILVIFRKFAL